MYPRQQHLAQQSVAIMMAHRVGQKNRDLPNYVATDLVTCRLLQHLLQLI